GLVIVGAGGAVESSVTVGTAVAADTLPAASVTITLKLLAASWVSGTEIEKLAEVPLTTWEPATVSPLSIRPSLLVSFHTCTLASWKLSVAVPWMVYVGALMVTPLAGIVTVGAVAVVSTVKTGIVTKC